VEGQYRSGTRHRPCQAQGQTTPTKTESAVGFQNTHEPGTIILIKKKKKGWDVRPTGEDSTCSEKNQWTEWFVGLARKRERNG